MVDVLNAEDFVKYAKETFNVDIVLNDNTADAFQLFSPICKQCMNNSKNGGSGICHCILGTPIIY